MRFSRYIYSYFLFPVSLLAEIGSGVGKSGSIDISARPKYPPDLRISGITFSEPSGNDALDAYEKGSINFSIKNHGRGDAIGVEVKAVGLTGTEGVSFLRAITVGNIPSGTSRKVSIELSASLAVQDGTIKLRIEANERFGFDADPFTFTVESRAFVPPELVIADIGIDDDKEETGDSYGDNDGIIELGEAIEVTAVVQNVGGGDAEGVTAKIEIEGEGDNIYYGSDKKVFSLGDIKSGDFKLVKFFFMTSKRYTRQNLPISIKVTEKMGKYGIEEPLGLVINEPTKRVKEIVIARKEIAEAKPKASPLLSIDVDNIPTISVTELEDGLCVIFGIEEYKYAPKAAFANRDAAVFYEYAKSVFGVPEQNIQIKTNEGATKGEFDKVFGEDSWLKRRTIPGKTDVIIYFSGHGAPDLKTRKPYIIPYDIDPNYASTGYALDDIYKRLSDLGAKSVTVFLDACFSGQSRDEQMLLADAKPLFIPATLPEPYEKITVFTASRGNEVSSAYREKKHGVFTYFLLKGLQGNADTDEDKDVTISELFKYVSENVPETAVQMDREQTPTLQPTVENLGLSANRKIVEY